jgi:V/A-type H+-transporting ATPase subunit E
MTGSEKVLDCIRADGEKRVKKIQAEADFQAAQIISAGRLKAEETAVNIEKEADLKAADMRRTAKSSGELAVRNAVLLRKREEIEKTVNGVIDYLCALKDQEYFEALYSMARRMGKNKGIILLNARDLSRLPSDFIERMKDCSIEAEVSEQAHDMCGGFILKCGEIELSADFRAVAQEKRNELEDFINSSLFKK